ncbi:MAG: hypothetical protein ABIP97_03965 [Chthoniobacterales bacterium]
MADRPRILTPMAKNSIFFGLLLIIVGVVGYLHTGMQHPTALIPAAIGVILFLCGIVVLFNANLRKHVMHVAALVALLGFGGTVAAYFHIPEVINHTAKFPDAIIAKCVTALLCLIFLILCIRSFIAARRARLAA